MAYRREWSEERDRRIVEEVMRRSAEREWRALQARAREHGLLHKLHAMVRRDLPHVG